MADAHICELVLDELARSGEIVVRGEGQVAHAFHLGGQFSNNQVLKALGSLINRNAVVRRRQHPQHMGDDDRPITYSLPKD